MTNRLVTILMAAFNEERHIVAVLETFFAQTYQPLEIIVIDDGSTDTTLEKLRAYPQVKVLQQAHLGKAAAMNLGAKQATGDILIFVDADIRYDVRYVETLVTPIFKGEALGTSHGMEFVANPENRWARCDQQMKGLPPDRRFVLSEKDIAEGSIVYRAIGRERYLAVGGFDQTGFLDDQTLYPKLGQRARWVMEAKCAHYNPDTLQEVYESGVWGGKSYVRRWGVKSVLRRNPITAVYYGFAQMFRRGGTWDQGVFKFVYEIGVCYGILHYRFINSKNLGK